MGCVRGDGANDADQGCSSDIDIALEGEGGEQRECGTVSGKPEQLVGYPAAIALQGEGGPGAAGLCGAVEGTVRQV